MITLTVLHKDGLRHLYKSLGQGSKMKETTINWTCGKDEKYTQNFVKETFLNCILSVLHSILGSMSVTLIFRGFLRLNPTQMYSKLENNAYLSIHSLEFPKGQISIQSSSGRICCSMLKLIHEVVELPQLFTTHPAILCIFA